MTIEMTPIGRTAGEILSWSRATVDGPLRDAVGQLPGALRQIAGYHFGWLTEDGEPARGDAGKAIRPALALLSSCAVGGDAEAAIPAAVAVELVHNFSLLHDDVMDKDELRRHRPTAWKVFGTAEAILAGDALLALASRYVARTAFNPGTAVEWLGESVVKLCLGQADDISFEHRDNVEVEECWGMAGNKTGELLGVSCALGALAGGADITTAHLMRGFGEHLGQAFQLTDDLLGIWGDPAQTGKPAHSDLHNRKKSLPVVAALRSGTSYGDQLAELYLHTPTDECGNLGHLADLIERAGGRAWAEQNASTEAELALDFLDSASSDETASAGLRELAHLMIGRKY
ncbi:MAG TPA: polyprenyl synthetase family protein [Pseudonocardiaceae bacterium]|jgi:geranylgeranyl diphosphate synthase type I|nr:polyprenyl synthetase family protein [Pseudonocardiaceae bacterium]